MTGWSRAGGMAAVVTGAWVAAGWAQPWSAVHLHPAGAQFSQVFAVSSAGQGGWLLLPGISAGPVIWHGSSSGWTSLGVTPSVGAVYGMTATQQVGDFVGHASLWSGTAQSRIDLHPSGAVRSRALAVAGQQQVGSMYLSTAAQPEHAVLWHGSAASAVDLHPVGARYSRATATDGEYQGGWMQDTVGIYAALWHGSAESIVNMNPPWAWTSQITGMAPGQQVGWAQVPVPGGGSTWHATLWSGSAASAVDLNPPGAGLSQILGTCGSAQVGVVNFGGFANNAAIWFGTPESYVDLSQFLPPGYYQSLATSVYEEKGVFYVGGYATSVVTGQNEAFLWIGVPSPGTAGVLLAAGVWGARRRRG